MALPWTAPDMGQGVYPGQASFFSPHVDPAIWEMIIRQRQAQNAQMAQYGDNITHALGKFLEDQKHDEIANQIMNQYNAPRAAAVNPESFDPALAASQGLNYTPHGDSLDAYMKDSVTGPPATAPATGGADALQAVMATRQMQMQDAKSTYQDQLMQARAGHLNALTTGSGTAPSSSGTPIVDQATGLIWNGRQWVKPPTGPRAVPTAQDKTVSEMGQFGLQPNDLSNIDAAQSDIIPPKGTSSQKMSLVTKDGRQATVPWATWQKWSNMFNQGSLSKQSATPQASRGTAPQSAIDYLAANPQTKDQFFAKYGYLP